MGAHLGRFRSEFGHLVTRAGQSHSAHQVRSAADRDLRPLQGRASGHRSGRLGRIGQGPGAGVTPAGWGRSPHRTGPGRSATGLEPGPGSHQEVVGGHSLAPGPGQTADHRRHPGSAGSRCVRPAGLVPVEHRPSPAAWTWSLPAAPSPSPWALRSSWSGSLSRSAQGARRGNQQRGRCRSLPIRRRRPRAGTVHGD